MALLPGTCLASSPRGWSPGARSRHGGPQASLPGHARGPGKCRDWSAPADSCSLGKKRSNKGVCAGASVTTSIVVMGEALCPSEGGLMCHHEGVSTYDILRKVPVGGDSGCHGRVGSSRHELFLGSRFHSQGLLCLQPNYANRHPLLWKPPCSERLRISPLPASSPCPPPPPPTIAPLC